MVVGELWQPGQMLLLPPPASRPPLPPPASHHLEQQLIQQVVSLSLSLSLSLPTSFSKAGPLQPGRIIRPQRQTNIMWPLPKQLPGQREPLPKPLPRKGDAAKPLSKAWLKRRIPLHEKWPVLGDLHCNLDVIFDDLHGIERPAKRRRLLAEASQSYIHIMYIIYI